MMLHNYRTITFAFDESLMISPHYTSEVHALSGLNCRASLKHALSIDGDDNDGNIIRIMARINIK